LSFPEQEQHFLHFFSPLYTYSDHLLFWFMPYLIASSFLLNSFSYLIIPPPPPTPLLLLLLLYGC